MHTQNYLSINFSFFNTNQLKKTNTNTTFTTIQANTFCKLKNRDSNDDIIDGLALYHCEKHRVKMTQEARIAEPHTMGESDLT